MNMKRTLLTIMAVLMLSAMSQGQVKLSYMDSHDDVSVAKSYARLPKVSLPPAPITQQWSHWGTATPNSAIVELFTQYAEFQASDKAMEVDFRYPSEGILEFKLKNFLGTGSDIIITNNTVDNTSYISDQDLNVANPFYDGTDGSYLNWHIHQNTNVGSPRDGKQIMNFWLLIKPNYGYDLTRTQPSPMLTFESQYIAHLSYNKNAVYTDTDKISLPITYSQSVTKVQLSLNKYKCNRETLDRYVETLIDATMDAQSTIEVPLTDGRGIYILAVNGYDSYGLFGNQEYKYIYCQQPDETHSWKSLGTGLFKDTYYSKEVWFEKEIQQATDKEGLYRVMNPYNNVGEYGEYRPIEGQDFFLEFGPGIDDTDYELMGLRYGYNDDLYNQYFAIYSQHVDNPELPEGWFQTNYGYITLPGVNNYNIEFKTAQEATTTPMVSKVEYVVVGSEKGCSYKTPPTPDFWFNVDGINVKTAVTDEKHQLRFDLGADADQLSLVVARPVDANNKPLATFSKINYSTKGWKDVGEANILPMASKVFDNVMSAKARVMVNPFDRSVVRILNPFRQFADMTCMTIYGTEARADFSRDGSIYLVSHPTGLVYATDSVATQPGPEREPDRSLGFYSEYNGYKYSLDFETTTNIMLRSYSSMDTAIEKSLQAEKDKLNVFPRRHGNTILLPTLGYYVWGSGDSKYPTMTIYAPTEFDVSEELSFSPEVQTFVVGNDVARVRYLAQSIDDTATREAVVTLEEFIADETIGQFISVANSRTEALNLSDGKYNIMFASYNKNGNIGDVNQAECTIDRNAVGTITEDSASTPVYYNLQGISVANPVPGNIYIMKTGSKITKVKF